MNNGTAAWWIVLLVLVAVGGVSLHNVFLGAFLGVAAVALIIVVLGLYSLIKRLTARPGPQ